MRALLATGRRYSCPACGGGFRRFGPGPGGRPNAACPRCGSLERHRYLALVLRHEVFAEPVGDVLHLAPDGTIRRLLEDHASRYVGADLDPRPGDVRVDLQDLPFDDASFDLLVCSHVLEHVPDDTRAMREMHRVLRPQGRALLQHPVDFEIAATVEDPSVVDPAERARRFGQADHVRKYGRDISQRLEAAGFEVSVRTSRDLTLSERERFRLQEPWEPQASGADVYVCERR